VNASIFWDVTLTQCLFTKLRGIHVLVVSVSDVMLTY
jgi:hypothetical protein